MVYTVTFNPAVDYVMNIEKLNSGEVNRCANEEFQIGGKGINVSLMLKTLGINNIALGFVSGFTGAYLQSQLNSFGVDTDFINLNNGTTRINVKLKSDDITEINANGPTVSNESIKSLFDKLNYLQDGDILVLAGSIPNSVDNNIYEKIMQHLSNKQIKIVIDATKDLLWNTLKYKPFLIKPNNFELEEIFGVKISTNEKIIEYATKLQEKGAKNVLVSMGENGAILLDENGITHEIKAVKGKIKNTVGSGDSMVAGFLSGYVEKNDYEYALKLGSASGSATAFSNTLATKSKIDEILSMI